jgi:predicted GH43/DUF377 family glycosyl hydrolase
VLELPSLQRLPENPLLGPRDVHFTVASGAFNPAACVDHKSGRVVILPRIYEPDARRSCLGLALSTDGVHIDEVWDRPALFPEEPYEAWGIEDARITFLADEGRYAITYTGYCEKGPRVCLVTTDDLLDVTRYRRHGPRIAGDNKNTVVFPEKIGGRYAVLHRPMPRIVLAEVARLEDPWPEGGTPVLGPEPGTWRSGRVGAGAPPMRTPHGWLVPFHGATNIAEGNVYAMGWLLLDANDPTRVRFVSDRPALAPEASYEIWRGPLPQVDVNNFKDGVRVVFPSGMVSRGDDLLVYYGAADVYVAAARVRQSALLEALGRNLGGR